MFFRQRIDEQPLWRLGVRIDTPEDLEQLAWLVQCRGAARVRAAALRRTALLAPRPPAVADELHLTLPAQAPRAQRSRPLPGLQVALF